MPDTPAKRDNTLMIGLVLAVVIAVLILAGATIFNSGSTDTNVTVTEPTQQTPTP